MQPLIRRIELYPVSITLKEPFVISLGPLYHADNVIVKISTDLGITGFGECSPFATIHGETQQTCLAVGERLASLLLGQNPLEIETLVQQMDAAIYGNACIKSALDMALYDIAARHAELPLYAFLGGEKKPMQTDYTVSFGHPTKMAADAANIKKLGFQIIKVKLGGTRADDLERIRLIREAVGMEIPLRIDANQGWDVETAIGILHDLVPFHIQHCEEPIARWNFLRLPEVARASPIPIMADESCCGPHDAQRLIELDACQFFNLKLSKAGGIFKSLKMIRMAEEAGKKMQIGGFLESRLGFTAAAHLACTSPKVQWFDFDTPLMMSEDPVTGGLMYGNQGNIALSDEPGLAAYISADYLGRYPKIEVG